MNLKINASYYIHRLTIANNNKMADKKYYKLFVDKTKTLISPV